MNLILQVTNLSLIEDSNVTAVHRSCRHWGVLWVRLLNFHQGMKTGLQKQCSWGKNFKHSLSMSSKCGFDTHITLVILSLSTPSYELVTKLIQNIFIFKVLSDNVFLSLDLAIFIFWLRDLYILTKLLSVFYQLHNDSLILVSFVYLEIHAQVFKSESFMFFLKRVFVA